MALLQILGGHWVILQSVGWVGMVVSYANQDSTLDEAIKKTFDGQHPCGVCKLVKSGRASEKKQEVSNETIKFEAVLPRGVQSPMLARKAPYVVRSVDGVPDRFTVVPTPPPRLA